MREERKNRGKVKVGEKNREETLSLNQVYHEKYTTLSTSQCCIN